MDTDTGLIVIDGAAFGVLIQRLFALGARLDPGNCPRLTSPGGRS